MSSERIYRDSVHNIIRLATDTPEGALLARLVDTREFQRLRRIRQLGLAHFAYQGAEHSRFTHSLGVMHIATRILEKLSNSYDITPEQRIAVRVAALLHDVGHGAFSHVLESVLDFHHEDLTVEIVTSKKTEIGQVLSAFSDTIADDVAAIIEGTFRPMALAQLVSSQLDVDRMDYLLRDSLMTGAKYGVYDHEWIIKSLKIDQKNDRLYVSARGIYAVEDYLQARYYMFRQVYFHRTLRSAEVILKSVLRRAMEIRDAGEDVWMASDSGFERVIRKGRPSIEDHLEIDDTDVLYHIKRWQHDKDPILSDLAKRFLNRKLFKVFDLDMPEEKRADFLRKSHKLIEEAGFDPDYYHLEDEAGKIANYFYTSNHKNPKNLIYAEDGFAAPDIREISEISAPVRGLQKGIKVHRLCFPHELTEAIEEIYHHQ